MCLCLQHISTCKYTPFFLMFGRRATLPVDINCHHVSAPPKIQQDYDNLEDPDVSTMIGDRQRILEEAKKNIIEAQAKQKDSTTGSMPSPSIIRWISKCSRKILHERKLKVESSRNAILAHTQLRRFYLMECMRSEMK